MPDVSPPNRTLSVVVPLWNEEAGLPQLIARLLVLQKSCSIAIEFVMVNDGSTDATSQLLRAAMPGFLCWKLVELSRNFGQQAAYRAGLDHASGDAVVFLDGDLQDPPELILEMIPLWESGAKVVIACRRTRPERGIRGWLLKSFHRLFHRLTDAAIPKGSGMFGLMDRLVADHVRQLPEVNLFLPGLRSWCGYRQEIVWYDRAARLDEPKQSLRALFDYAWNAVTSFSDLPLKAIGFAGLLISLAGFCYATVLILIKVAQFFGYFRELVVMGFTTLAVAMLFIGGIQLLCLGVIGEYLGRAYKETKRRPLYLLAEVLQSSPRDGSERIP